MKPEPRLTDQQRFDWLRLTPIGFDARVERDFEKPLLIPGRTDQPWSGSSAAT